MNMKKQASKLTHRAHLIYSGHVQGVGFRYTSERLALELGLLGFVRNLPNGCVEVVCEGPKHDIEKFLESVQKSHLASAIKKTVCDWEKPTNTFTDFRIEFCL